MMNFIKNSFSRTVSFFGNIVAFIASFFYAAVATMIIVAAVALGTMIAWQTATAKADLSVVDAVSVTSLDVTQYDAAALPGGFFGDKFKVNAVTPFCIDDGDGSPLIVTSHLRGGHSYQTMKEGDFILLPSPKDQPARLYGLAIEGDRLFLIAASSLPEEVDSGEIVVLRNAYETLLLVQ